MPGFDKTGPEGQGSRTGRMMGKCNSKNTSCDGSGLRNGSGGHGFGNRENSGRGKGAQGK